MSSKIIGLEQDQLISIYNRRTKLKGTQIASAFFTFPACCREPRHYFPSHWLDDTLCLVEFVLVGAVVYLDFWFVEFVVECVENQKVRPMPA